MPNWCTTSYALTGGRKEVRSLYNKMKRLQERKTPLVPNGFGTTWLGCLVKALGGDPEKVYCRGQWSGLRLTPEGVLFFDTEHAWSRPAEVEMLLEKAYPSLRIYFLEEELGMDIFQTNDATGEYFKEQVIIDEESDGMEYYTEEAALVHLTELAGKPITSWEEAEAFTNAINEAQDEGEGEEHIWLHKAEIY